MSLLLVAHLIIGGSPDLIQVVEDDIAFCGRQLTFYGQFASIGGESEIVDGGMIYVLLCYHCFDPRSFLQFP